MPLSPRQLGIPTYVAAYWTGATRTWRDAWPLGTVTAPSLDAARRIARDRWMPLEGGPLRVARVSAVPADVVARALARDGAALLAEPER